MIKQYLKVVVGVIQAEVEGAMQEVTSLTQQMVRVIRIILLINLNTQI